MEWKALIQKERPLSRKTRTNPTHKWEECKREKDGALHIWTASGVIQIQPVAIYLINAEVEKINIGQGESNRNIFFILRKVKTTARFVSRINDNGNLCHFPPKTWS